VATNNDPDETDVLDLVMARHRIAELMGRDGLDADEVAALAALDQPINRVATRVRVWGALLSIMRNGLTRHTATRAKDSGIAVIVDRDRQVMDIVAEPARLQALA